jgi:hypothetical protein
MQIQFIRVAAGLALAACASAALAADLLPLRGNDLSSDERYSTRVHKSGIQAEGKDIGAVRNVSGKKWSGLKAGATDKSVVTNWVVYGKPVYAMAAGKIYSCWRNAPDNVPGSKLPEYDQKKISGGGNHLWILQDDGVRTLYAHMQPGSVPADLCPHNKPLMSGTDPNEDAVADGARVKAGQMIGRVGNTGSSDGPHLHVHMQKDGKPLPMTFARGMTTPRTADGEADPNGPWTRIAGKELPKASILLWPPHTIGSYGFDGVKAANYQRLFDHMADSGMMPKLISCASNGATYDSTWIPAEGEWRSHHGMSAADAAAKQALYTGQGFTRTSNFTCGSATVSVWRK